MDILFGILSALASELTFLISFILIYSIIRLLHFVYALIRLRNRLIWFIDGVVTGTCSLFLACYVANLILHNHNFSELAIILFAITLPVIGEVGYYRYLTKNIRTVFISRFHLVIKGMIQRSIFVVYESILTEKLISENRGDELKNEENKHALGKEAYDMAQGELAYLTIWNWVGYITSIFLVHHFIF